MSRKVVNYNQKGYVGQSMSARAKTAYNSGEMPLYKWSKKAIITFLEENDYPLVQIEKAKKLSLKELREQALKETSWHHTGKFANKTSFYSLVAVEDLALKTEDEKKNELDEYLVSELENVKDFLNSHKEDVILIGNYGIKTRDVKSFGTRDFMSVLFRKSNDFDAEVTRLVEEHNKSVEEQEN